MMILPSTTITFLAVIAVVKPVSFPTELWSDWLTLKTVSVLRFHLNNWYLLKLKEKQSSCNRIGRDRGCTLLLIMSVKDWLNLSIHLYL